MKFLSICLFMALIMLNTTASRADYPTPEKTGFHHCALIYYNATRTSQDLLPYAARITQGTPKEWFFDAFLFLNYSSPRAMDTLTGATNKSDWQFQLDHWFAPGRDLAALESAIETASKTLGEPPSPRKIILAIPYPNPTVENFGDVDGDGKSDSAATAAGREKILRWYCQEAQERFKAAKYRHLQLWGFYWMREDMPVSDEPIVRQAARQVHGDGLKFFWIPYHLASGWERWRQVGFDTAVMQPGYAFTFSHHGTARRNRLAVNAELSRVNGLGVELECGNVFTEPHDRFYFQCYLADGGSKQLGYQLAPTASYLGNNIIEQMVASKRPEIQALYQQLADFVTGKAVPDPDIPLVWHLSPPGPYLTQSGLHPGQSIRQAEAQLDTPQQISRLDIFLDEPDNTTPWTGTIVVEIQKPGSKIWKPGGWHVRTGRAIEDHAWQAVTVPIGQKVSGLRVSLRGIHNGALPKVRGISAERGEGLDTHFHLAQFRPYLMLPAPEPVYPDQNHLLTDGVIPKENFLGKRTAGWLRRSVTLLFRLDHRRPISRIEVHCQGGGLGAVNWPENAWAAFSSTTLPPTTLNACGALPPDIHWILPEPLAIDLRRKADDCNGHLTFLLSEPIRAEYVTIGLEPNTWLMLTEVRIFDGETNIAPLAKYELFPPPTSGTNPTAWEDDGKRLTDGVVASSDTADQLTGWDTGDWRTIQLDLGAVQTIHEVTAWSLAGGHAGIYAPDGAETETSADGVNWLPFGHCDRPEVNEDGKSNRAIALKTSSAAAVSTRFVRIRVRRRQGWAMLSEVEVR